MTYVIRVFIFSITPFAVHYEKIRNHLRETATNSAKIHSLARKFSERDTDKSRYFAITEFNMFYHLMTKFGF